MPGAEAPPRPTPASDCPPQRLACSLGTWIQLRPASLVPPFVSAYCPDVPVTEALGTLSCCAQSGDTWSPSTHGGRPWAGSAPSVLPSSAPVVVVGVAPTFFFHVVTLAFSSDPLLNLPTPFKSLFVCLLWVWGGAISLVWSADVEFLGDKMRSQVGRDSDPPPRLPGHRRLPGHSAGLPVLPPQRPLGRLCPQQQPGGAVETKVGHRLKLLQ